MLEFDERIIKYAIVDIGANSVRMNIYDIDTQTGEFSVAASARSMLGLAAYAKNGTLSNDGAGKLFAVLREFLARANSIPCDLFSAFATASLRGLSNSKKILRDIKAGLGIDIEIISGAAEARYDHAAIRFRFPETENGILIDMGGGSTEIVHFEGDGVRNAVSLPIGCVMLGKNFTACTKKDPFPNETEMENIRINRDSRNLANRATNCDQANLNKQLSAGAKQAEAITAYSLRHSLGGLPRDLQELGRLRMLHPEMSLTDLGSMLSAPVGKSGVNHKMRKLMNLITEETSKDEGEKE